MNVEELKEVFRKAGVFVVPIIDSTDPDKCQGLHFDGELSEFIKVLIALDIKTVFVAEETLSEEFLEQEIHYNDEGDTIPIVDAYPDIVQYKAKLGEACDYKVLAKGVNFDLNLFISEDWWVQLTQHIRESCMAIRERESLKDLQLEKLFNAKRVKVLNQIKSLVKDDKFIKLKTQGAMAAYAQEHIEDLYSVMDETELKKEIQRINDLLLAKGLK